MANYENQPRYGGTVVRGADSAIDAGLRAYMIRVYNYMVVGLVLTGGAAWLPSILPSRRSAGSWPTPSSARPCSGRR
jgi:FtsH-binding integral membrane protein